MVTKTGATALAATVDFATAPGTTNPATSGAACGAGVDYVSQNGTLTFAAADTTKTITVKVCGETVFEECYAENPLVNVMCLSVTLASTVSLPKMFSIPDVVPVPSSVMVSLPSTVTGGNDEMTFIADVIAMLC